MKRRPTTAMAFYLALAVCVSGGALAANLVKPAKPLSPARAALAPTSTAHRGGTAGARPVPLGHAGTQGVSSAAAQQGGVAGSTSTVSTLPGSGIVREPSMAVDSTGAIFVTAPSNLEHSSTQISASPLWKSTDGGVTWTGPISTENGGQSAAGLGGAASDIAIGPGDSVYVASNWTGNTSMAVSTDHGATFTQLPVGHPSPADSRPWLYYDPGTTALFMDWDGAGALHVGKTLTGVTPQAQLLFAQDVPAVDDPNTRGCTSCAAPSNVVIDPFGAGWVVYPAANGLGVATSSGAFTNWTQVTFVPNTRNVNASNAYQVLRSDNEGNLYLVWTQMADGGATLVYLSYLKHGDQQWHAPIAVSNSDAVFGTLAVVSPGVVDVAYYGNNTWHSNPNSAPNSSPWDLDLTQVNDLFGTPKMTTADLLPNMHTGGIYTGTLDLTNPNPQTSLGNFFSMTVDSAGLAEIVTTVDDGSGTKLQFVHQQPAPPAPTPAPQFMLPTPPQSGTAAGPAYPYGSVPDHNVTVPTPAPTPDASTSSGGGDVATAAAPSTDTGKTGRPSGPKYPDGVAITTGTPASAGVDGGGHGGLPLWAYLLAGGGGMVGRFVYKRGRG